MFIVGEGVMTRVGVGVEVAKGVEEGLVVAVGDGRTVSVGLGGKVAGCRAVGVNVGRTVLVASATAGSSIAVASGRLSAADRQATRTSIPMASESSTE
jgi:hypothetical protein